jgi:type I restriction enzyme S subunit
MKNSGIAWIGKIPEEWCSTIIKRYCSFKTGGTPSTQNQEWFNGSLDWFTPCDFNEQYYLKCSERKLSAKAREDNVAAIVPANTVMIIGIGGTAGKIGITTSECSFNQQITALITNKKIVPKYLMYWMIANSKILLDTALYTTLPIINNQTIGEYPLVLPNEIREQIEIANFLDQKCSEIDALIAKKTQFLTELENYKKSLIYEVVTGKREVLS